MSAIDVLHPSDLAMLLATDPAQWLGRIMELNRAPHYHNRINAIDLMARLGERQVLPTPLGISEEQ